jgi:hypothetical protein
VLWLLAVCTCLCVVSTALLLHVNLLTHQAASPELFVEVHVLGTVGFPPKVCASCAETQRLHLLRSMPA